MRWPWIMPSCHIGAWEVCSWTGFHRKDWPLYSVPSKSYGWANVMEITGYRARCRQCPQFCWLTFVARSFQVSIVRTFDRSWKNGFCCQESKPRLYRSGSGWVSRSLVWIWSWLWGCCSRRKAFHIVLIGLQRSDPLGHQMVVWQLLRPVGLRPSNRPLPRNWMYLAGLWLAVV